jgi:hypothetical protein
MAAFSLWQLLNQRQPFAGNDLSDAAQQQQSSGQAIGQSLIDFWNRAQDDASAAPLASTALSFPLATENSPQSPESIGAKIIAQGLLNDNPAPSLQTDAAATSDTPPRSAGGIDDEAMQRILDYLERHPGVPDDGFPPDLEIRKRQVEGGLQSFDPVEPRTRTMQDRENYEYATNPEYKALFDNFDEFMKNYGRLPSGTAYLRQELKRRLHDAYGVPNYETDEPAYERDAPWIAERESRSAGLPAPEQSPIQRHCDKCLERRLAAPDRWA